jgi:hypothetical protein
MWMGSDLYQLDTPIARVLYYRMLTEEETFHTFYLTADGKVAFVETGTD